MKILSSTDALEPSDYKISSILSEVKTIAMVGASGNWKRPSFFVMKYLLKHGYKVIPVNPSSTETKILGEKIYKRLEEIPFTVDLVDIFRPSKECVPITKSAIKIKANFLWMQIGIENKEAAKIAENAGLQVVMNRCPKIEHSRLSGLLGLGGFYPNFISARREWVSKPPAPPRNGGLFKTKRLSTLSVHAGTRPDSSFGARNMPIYQTTAYSFDDADHAQSLFNLQEPGNVYGRLSNPTTSALEQRIAALDQSVGACCVSSGHAAQLMALYPLMTPKKKLIASSRLYGGSLTQFSHAFKQFGWEVGLIDVTDLSQIRRAVEQPNVSALFVESLANPDGNITDIEKLADIANHAGIPLIVDNTMATPILCQPKQFGADLIVYSTTKFLSGHGNAMGGAVVDTGNFKWQSGRDFPALNDPDQAYHGIKFSETFGPLAFITFCHARVLRDLGLTMAPLNAYLTLLGLETLPLRMKKHMRNAAKVAKFLDCNDKVVSVSWAGLKTNSYHNLAKKYLKTGFGSVFTFSILGDFNDALKVVENCNLISHVANIGDTRSLITHPASTTHRQLDQEQRAKAGASDNAIRLSIGIEHHNDIIDDLNSALRRI